MTIDDIKVGQTWVWGDDNDNAFIITDIRDNNITWMVVNTGEVLNRIKYTPESLLYAYNNGSCRLISESTPKVSYKTPKVSYNMDKFKFI